MFVKIEFKVRKIDVSRDLLSDLERYLQDSDIISHMTDAEVIISDE